MPNIRIEENKERGTLVLMVEGDPYQGQPWRIELSPDSAYMVGNNLSLSALKMSAAMGSPCMTLVLGGGQQPDQGQWQLGQGQGQRGQGRRGQGGQRQSPTVEMPGSSLAPDTFPETSVETVTGTPLTTEEVLSSPPEGGGVVLSSPPGEEECKGGENRGEA